ncbi:MAG: archaeosortase/exosortase family protein [Bacteroidales bacterium]|nr:archaeosortase/exosortase family protein [Bacteroidales bacterium]
MIKNIKKKYWLRFLIGGIISFVLIYVFYHILRKNDVIDDLYVDILNYYAKILLICSKFITELFGFEVVTFGKTVKIIDDFKASGVYLDRGCMGRNVMLGYAALIAVFPGKFLHKLWYIPMGLIVITFVNILRISGLAITAYCCPQYSDVNHYVIFKVVAWVVIFILWIIWFNNFSPFAKKKKLKA